MSRVLRRIIPARAGFTCVEGVADASLTDHPRSRGVYSLQDLRARAHVGSSPLARGLPRRQFDTICLKGIIPARAGFTLRSVTARTTRTDHPRSRGVYRSPRRAATAAMGSSPLARGLLTHLLHRPGQVRIIPARAGFTARARARSRRASGSSPLARGLPQPDRAASRHAGIIPARAGFTGLCCDLLPLRGDHPRSRGVYPRVLRAVVLSTGGSSPLARGLHYVVCFCAVGLRIIPARAGFTGRRVMRHPRRPDHPRSRGVYARKTVL